MVKTLCETEAWKRFRWQFDGCTRIYSEVELLQIHPELTALVHSLSQEDNMSLTIRTGDSVSVSIISDWEILPEF